MSTDITWIAKHFNNDTICCKWSSVSYELRYIDILIQCCNILEKIISLNWNKCREEILTTRYCSEYNNSIIHIKHYDTKTEQIHNRFTKIPFTSYINQAFIESFGSLLWSFYKNKKIWNVILSNYEIKYNDNTTVTVFHCAILTLRLYSFHKHAYNQKWKRRVTSKSKLCHDVFSASTS